MAQPKHIVARAEVLSYLGKAGTATDAEVGVISMMQKMVEARIRTFLRYDPCERDHVDFQPYEQGMWYDDDDEGFLVTPIGPFWGNVNAPEYLTLRHFPVRSISEVRVSSSGMGVPANFPDETIQDPDSYWLDLDETGVSISGRLWRTFGVWSGWPRSIMISYHAGYSEEELDGIAADIKLAALEAILERWNTRLQSNRVANMGAAGPVTSERTPDYAITFAKSDQQLMAATAAMGLPAQSITLLEPYQRNLMT